MKLSGDILRKFVSVIQNFMLPKSKQVEDNMWREQLKWKKVTLFCNSLL